MHFEESKIQARSSLLYSEVASGSRNGRIANVVCLPKFKCPKGRRLEVSLGGGGWGGGAPN